MPSVLRQGTDLSSYQDVRGCDWETAAKVGEAFCVVKLSGGSKVSPGGLEHVARLLEHHASGPGPKVVIGAYHFAQLKRGGWKDPEGQARAFIEAIRQSRWTPPKELLEGTGIPSLWLDVEWQSFRDKVAGRLFRRTVTSERIREFCRRFIGTVQGELGVPVGIYTGRSFVKYRFKHWSDLRLYPLWLAGYVRNRFNRDQLPSASEWPGPLELEDGYRAEACLWQWIGGAGRTVWYKRTRRGYQKAIDRNLARVA